MCDILVVDDDEGILETVVDILESEGYQVTTAGNGQEALERIGKQQPDVILLDMRMPVLDGWGFARRAREQQLSLHILVMTAAQDARRWATEIGAQGVVPKPFELPDLLDAIERACTTVAALSAKP